MKTQSLAAAAAVMGAAAVAYERWLKPWQERWGATDEEVALALPGDELVAEPAAQMTRAITIDAPREEVWPWIVQLGADRGGFYTYDCLENLFGLGIHSADDIVEEWQDLDGRRRRLRRPCPHRRLVRGRSRPHEALVLQVGDLAAGRPLRRDEKLGWEFLWTFALRDAPGGGTRLLVRERVAFDSAITKALMAPVGLVSFVMTRGHAARHQVEGRAPACTIVQRAPDLITFRRIASRSRRPAAADRRVDPAPRSLGVLVPQVSSAFARRSSVVLIVSRLRTSRSGTPDVSRAYSWADSGMKLSVHSVTRLPVAVGSIRIPMWRSGSPSSSTRTRTTDLARPPRPFPGSSTPCRRCGCVRRRWHRPRARRTRHATRTNGTRSTTRPCG